MKKFIVELFALLLCASAQAQTGKTVTQSGNVTPGHVSVWATNGVVKDGGNPTAGVGTGFGITHNGVGFCQNSGPVSTAYEQLCWGVTSLGIGTLSLNGYAGAPLSVLRFNLNGSDYDFPYSVGGIVGPNSSTVGNIPVWNNTSGSLLADSGISFNPFGVFYNQTPCNVSLWTFYDSTQGAVPSCFADILSGQININFGPVTGTNNPSITNTQHLIQTVTRLDSTQQEYASSINLMVETGGDAPSSTPTNQKVGQFISVGVYPGGSNSWSLNTDITQYAGVGDYPFYGIENDISNFNKEFAPGGNVSAAFYQVLNSSNRITALYFASAFVTPGTGNPSALASYYGFALDGSNLISDNDWISGTSATYGFQLTGAHTVGYDTTTDTLSVAVNTKANQKVCLNSGDGCWEYVGSNTTQYKQLSGGIVVALVGSASAVNYFSILDAPTTFGPQLQAVGSDTNISLTIKAKGNGAVRVDSQVFNAVNVVAGTATKYVCSDNSGNWFAQVAAC